MDTINVLIVEDDKDTAKLIEKLLKNFGYIVAGIVATGKEAISKSEECKPDIVLMDIQLEGQMDGLETAKKIKLCSNIPVIYLTAYSDENKLKRAKVTEPFAYIIKPFKERELHANIQMALYKNETENKLKRMYRELQDSLAKVKLLSGLVPICANCKNIKDDKGNWEQIETYIENNSEALFSHGICLKCAKKLYPEYIK